MPTTNKIAPARVAMTIAGSDSSGGAGIQADLRAFAMLGVFGGSAVTALTAQNTCGVTAIENVSPSFLREQIAAILGDLPVAAIKTGMLASPDIVEAVALALAEFRGPLVVDPVMVAKGGDSLVGEAAVASLCRHLLPRAAILTPNRFEAGRLAGRGAPETLAAATDVARHIADAHGSARVVVKGIRAGDSSVDVVVGPDGVRTLAHPWSTSGRTHGSGCTFSAACCGLLACGWTPDAAIDRASALTSLAIERAPALGRGRSPVNALAWVNEPLP